MLAETIGVSALEKMFWLCFPSDLLAYAAVFARGKTTYHYLAGQPNVG